MSKRVKNIFSVAWMSAAIFAAILLVQWAAGQERPSVSVAESPATVTEPQIAEVEYGATVSGMSLPEMTSATSPWYAAVPEPETAVVATSGPIALAAFVAEPGVLEIPGGPQAATAEEPVISSVPSTVAPSGPSATFPWASPFELVNGLLDGAVVDSARATALILSCDDPVALREFLFASGIAVRVDGQTRALPQDFLVGVTAYEYAGAYCQADQDVLEKVEPLSTASTSWVTVLRFVDRSDAAAQFALKNPKRQYLIIADTTGLSTDALRVLAGGNIVGVVVGHYRAADDDPVDYETSVADVMRVTRAIRLVSDAPVLLAVGVVNIHTRDTERSWADAFGDDLKTFDGFALYGLVRFPAILEAAENPRELILRRMGLPDKPCILAEFSGTSFRYAAADRPYVEKVWNGKARALLTIMRQQGWRGLVTWSPDIDDARIKADALRSAMK